MASIESRPSSIRVRWRQDGLPGFQSETFGTMKDARKFRGAVESAGNRWPNGWVRRVGWVAGIVDTASRVDAGEPADSQRRNLSGYTLADYMTRWIGSDDCRASEQTRARYRNQIRDHIRGHAIGALPVEDVTREDMQSWVDWLTTDRMDGGKGHVYKTAKNLRGLVSSTYRRGALLETSSKGRPLATVNPCAGVRIHADKTTARKPRFLSLIEYAALLDNMAPEYALVVETFAGTGIRWGELSALRVSAFTGPTLTVFHGRKHSPDGNHTIGATKTAAGTRTVGIDSALTARLAEHVRGRKMTDPLFDLPSDGSFWRVWDRAIVAAGLDGPTRPRIHDLRHSHASWLLAAGVPLVAVSKRLGHADVGITANTYAHLAPDDAATMAALASLSLPSGARPRLTVVA